MHLYFSATYIVCSLCVNLRAGMALSWYLLRQNPHIAAFYFHRRYCLLGTLC